ncbi:MAG TPA: iron-sulfur cluster assembly accessory protein [Gammaproteobacteria bacterium]|nr:iron-sulfur cluster assembly accessory protein [Gammaproteobacteria bacterium]
MITFSPTAIAQIKLNLQENENNGMALRIAANMSADETVNYGMGFDEAREDDVQFTYDGVDFLVSPDCLELLNGAHLDFVEIEPGQHHFIFLNPNDPNYKPPTEEDAVD